MQLQHDRKISPAGGEFVLRLLHASGIYCLTKTHLMWSSQNALQQQRAKWGEQEREAGTTEAGMFPSSPRIPVSSQRCRGRSSGHSGEGTGGSPQTSDLCRGWTSQCQVHAALSWTKALCVQCTGIGITEGGRSCWRLCPSRLSFRILESLSHVSLGRGLTLAASGV